MVLKSTEPYRIAFFDFPGSANPDGIKNLLAKNIDFVIDEKSPQFIFYSVFGRQHLNYSNSIKIFFTGENVHADFNLCDYAFGFDWMTFEDRYTRCPNFLLYSEFEQLRNQKPLLSQEIVDVLRRPRFCNFIYSNASAHPYRDALFQCLNTFKPVDSAGLLHNNTGIFRGSPSLGLLATLDKLEFQRESRFSIVVENSSSPGYTTEKIVHALAADTIPIYWGDPQIGRQFNTKRFINCHNFASVDDVVSHVRDVDSNPDLAARILKEPIFPSGFIPEELTEAWLLSKLCGIMRRPLCSAFRRNRYVWGHKYEVERILEARSYEKSLRWKKIVMRIKNKLKQTFIV